MEQAKNNNQTGTVTAAGRSVYETKVGVEAVVRSGGKNSQLKGVVHEILYRDSLTVAPKNLASGAKGALSKSVTAMRDDVLLKQGGRYPSCVPSSSGGCGQWQSRAIKKVSARVSAETANPSQLCLPV